MMAANQVLPSTASVTADGHLSIGGCDLVALADEFGTPLVVYDEQHLREFAASIGVVLESWWRMTVTKRAMLPTTKPA